jgi:alpha,alpha-trehalase
MPAPKILSLGTATSNRSRYTSTTHRENFSPFDRLICCACQRVLTCCRTFQELALAHDHNRKSIILDKARLTENPVDRLSRMVKSSFWRTPTQHIDDDGLEIICTAPKNRTGRIHSRIYAPHRGPAMAEYFRKIVSEKNTSTSRCKCFLSTPMILIS